MNEQKNGYLRIKLKSGEEISVFENEPFGLCFGALVELNKSKAEIAVKSFADSNENLELSLPDGNKLQIRLGDIEGVNLGEM